MALGRVVLIPRLPDDLVLDVLFRTGTGFAVQVSDEEVQAITSRGIAVADLYASANEYAAAMQNLTRDEAIAAIETNRNQVLAALTPDERRQFGLA